MEATLKVLPLELHSCAPEDILASEVTVSCGGIVEERGVPLLVEFDRKADSRVERVSDRGSTGVREGWATSKRSINAVRALQELMLPGETNLRHHENILIRLPAIRHMGSQAVEQAACIPTR